MRHGRTPGSTFCAGDKRETSLQKSIQGQDGQPASRERLWRSLYCLAQCQRFGGPSFLLSNTVPVRSHCRDTWTVVSISEPSASEATIASVLDRKFCVPASPSRPKEVRVAKALHANRYCSRRPRYRRRGAAVEYRERETVIHGDGERGEVFICS